MVNSNTGEQAAVAGQQKGKKKTVSETSESVKTTVFIKLMLALQLVLMFLR